LRLIRFEFRGSVQLGCVEEDEVFAVEGNLTDGFQKARPRGSLREVRLLAPCQPTKVVAMAINFKGIDGYSEHMSEPMVFIKPASSVCAPYSDVVNPFPDLRWWGEAELGVVIRHRLRNPTRAELENGVLGFTIGNDVTVENVEGRDHHLARSKCPDSFCPLGPWIDTEFDASACGIEAVQNGEVIRRARSCDQIWQWPQILAWLTTWMTLEPWDVVLTGNPPDTVGMRYLEHGDTYVARVEGLGELKNRFVVKGE
jgi:2-keto-4-pentenoate hydratase/2-oxohepta-3-ene-1,7-dioic acid hydratase in catechol pathway